MTKVQHKNKSIKFHASRTRIKSSHLATAKKHSRQVFGVAKKSILTVIILTIMVVILTILIGYFSNPERVVIHKIESISADYYENYFYPNIQENSTTPIAEVMSDYTETGFTHVSLRQLLLFDNERHADAYAILSAYCETGDTYVQFFPIAPFGKNDYRVEYRYSCTF